MLYILMRLSQSAAAAASPPPLAVLNLALYLVYTALFLLYIHHNMDTVPHSFKKKVIYLTTFFCPLR
jgi:hypothetical protein